MELKELIEKYKAVIAASCHICGDFESEDYKECGCETEAKSNLAEQIVKDLERLLDKEKNKRISE